MKGILMAGLAASLSLGSFVVHADDALPQSNVMGNNASIGAGYTSNEGESGYYVDLRWQFNKYAEVSLNLNSFLNSERFDSEIFLGADAERFTPREFRPRHNVYNFSTTFRYPFVLSESTIIAPYAEFGLSKLSTATIDFVEQNATGGDATGGNTGGGTGQNIEIRRRSFADLDSFKFGAGLQMAFNNVHKVTLGAVGYSNDDDFTDIAIDDSQLGASFRYEYRPVGSLSYVLKLDTADQFGGSLFNVGLSWTFN